MKVVCVTCTNPHLRQGRIGAGSSVSFAHWLDDEQVAEVQQKHGKQFEVIGVTRNGKIYLNPEEALFMLEKRFLELQYNSMPLSVQQAYALLLRGPSCSPKEYMVYSHYRQLEWRLVRHKPPSSIPKPEASVDVKSETVSDLKSLPPAVQPTEPPVQLACARQHRIRNSDEPSFDDLLYLTPNDYRQGVKMRPPPCELLPEGIVPCKQFYTIKMNTADEPFRMHQHYRPRPYGRGSAGPRRGWKKHSFRDRWKGQARLEEEEPVTLPTHSHDVVAQNWTEVKRQKSVSAQLWTQKPVPLISPEDATSYEDVRKKLSTLIQVESADQLKQSSLKVTFDVYKPTSPFRKTSLGLPDARLVIVDFYDPVDMDELLSLGAAYSQDTVPFLVVQCSSSTTCMSQLVIKRK